MTTVIIDFSGLTVGLLEAHAPLQTVRLQKTQLPSLSVGIVQKQQKFRADH
jgi:hypothetical protein